MRTIVLILILIIVYQYWSMQLGYKSFRLGTKEAFQSAIYLLDSSEECSDTNQSTCINVNLWK